MRHVLFAAILILWNWSQGLQDGIYPSAIAIAAWLKYGGRLNARIF